MVWDRNGMTTIKGENIAVPLLRMEWDVTLPKSTKKFENDHHFNRLEGWSAPLLKMMLDETLPKPMKKYGNDRHLFKGRKSLTYSLGWCGVELFSNQ